MFPNTPLPTGFGSSSSIRFSASSLADSVSAVFSSAFCLAMRSSSAFLSDSTRASSSAFSAAILSASFFSASMRVFSSASARSLSSAALSFPPPPSRSLCAPLPLWRLPHCVTSRLRWLSKRLPLCFRCRLLVFLD